MDKILCAIYNVGRTSKYMKKCIDKLPGDVLVCTDAPEFWKHPRVKTVDADQSVAVSKNKILQAAINGEYDFVFIIEDHIQPNNKDVILEYVHIMKKYDLSVMLYGFDGNNNRVIGNRPNPCIICNDGRGRELYINRFPCESATVFRVKKDMKLFDERLHCLEIDYLLYDMAEQGDYPFKGFFFDIAQSWNEWKAVKDVEKIRNKTIELINIDRQLRGNLTLDKNVDKVIEYIKEHRD